MTEQEKIREGIKERLYGSGCPHSLLDFETDNLIQFLHSQRCRIEVKCPDCAWSQFADEELVGMTPCLSCNSTGYLIEPLIKEEK